MSIFSNPEEDKNSEAQSISRKITQSESSQEEVGSIHTRQESMHDI